MFLFHQSSRFVIILIHVCIFLNFALTRSDPRPPFVSKLVHYLSLDSPFYDANKSARDISFSDLHNSIARASYLTTPNNSSGTLFNDIDGVDTPLTPSPTSAGFLAHIKVGSGLLSQFVYMDTGSGLLWINCEPCGYNVPAPIFDPHDSSTFIKENCSLGVCDAPGAVSIQCHDNGTCSYTVRYAGDKFSKGYLARDSIKFINTEEILQHVAFGCARATNLQINGVLGLSNNKISLISQMQASKFAYCIGNISDIEYPYNILAIGNGIELQGKQTTIIIEDKYYLTLEAIKFDGKALDIDASVFHRNSSEYTGGMIVDTGSTYTFMPQLVVNKVEAAIVAFIGPSLPLNNNFTYKGYQMLCYDGLLLRDLDRWFPFFTFQFKGDDANMELPYENMFRQMDAKSFCSVVLPLETVGLGATVSILGNMMQQYYFISYDLSEKLFAFQRMECSWIPDSY